MSEAPKEAPAVKKYGTSADEPRFKTDQEKKEEVNKHLVVSTYRTTFKLSPTGLIWMTHNTISLVVI